MNHQDELELRRRRVAYWSDPNANVWARRYGSEHLVDRPDPLQ
jgi:hypothetical protein